GPDRIRAQAFPVPRNGGTIKFKIGISAPLELDEAGKARLVLPAIVDRNFSFAPDVQHSLWVESKTALNIATASAGAGMTTSAVGPELFRITGTLSDATLARSRPAIVALRDPATGPRAARLGSGPEIVQEIAQRTVAPPAALVIVVDGSARVAGKAAGIRAALDKIPTGAPAGLVIAGEPARRLAIAPWTDSQKRAASEMLDAADFSGGQDNTPALAGALGDLEKYDGAALLWVHGPQPVAFKGSAGMLEQAASRLMRRPQLWLMPTEPGPNETLPDMPWAWSARTVPGSGAFGADIAGLLDTLYRSAPRTVILRDKTPSAPAAGVSAAAPVAGSDHIARLWANETVLTLMAQGESNRAGAVTLATDHRLVTPVSGAVVLETQQQYDESHLTPVTTASVPTVPEPEEWALILLAGLAFLWLMKKQGANRVAA
ncbi:MAG: hypothetical protein ABL907_18640, partial [Hyphomicrobium sp.]